MTDMNVSCLLITAIAMGVLIAFWIQPGATERLVLLLVCLINNTLYLGYIYRMLPNNGDSVPLVCELIYISLSKLTLILTLSSYSALLPRFSLHDRCILNLDNNLKIFSSFKTHKSCPFTRIHTKFPYKLSSKDFMLGS